MIYQELTGIKSLEVQIFLQVVNSKISLHLERFDPSRSLVDLELDGSMLVIFIHKTNYIKIVKVIHGMIFYFNIIVENVARNGFFDLCFSQKLI